MSWQVKDEWIDLAQLKHTVIYHNPDVVVFDTKTGQLKPVEHQVVHTFQRADACPHCGHLKPRDEADQVDFKQFKADVLEDLHAQHRASHAYLELHPGVRIGHGPK